MRQSSRLNPHPFGLPSQVIEYCQFHVAAEKKDEHGKAAKSEDEIKVRGAVIGAVMLVGMLAYW